MIPTRKLPLFFDPALLNAALVTVAPGDWVRHFNKNEYEGDWRVAPLRALGGQATRTYSSPTATPEDYSATPILARSPGFQQVLDTFQCPLLSVRLMSLGAGSRIREHRDYTIEFEDNDARLHIPVATNPEVEFYLAGERVVMQEGETWYLDFGQPHSVYNGGATDRIHLVLDCVVNDWLRSLMHM